MLLGQKFKKAFQLSCLAPQSSERRHTGVPRETRQKNLKPTAEGLWQQRFKSRSPQLLPRDCTVFQGRSTGWGCSTEPRAIPGPRIYQTTGPRRRPGRHPAVLGPNPGSEPSELVMAPLTQVGSGRSTGRAQAGRVGQWAGPGRGGPASRSPNGRARRAGSGGGARSFPRWRPHWTELRGRLRGWGRRAAAEGGDRGWRRLPRLASPLGEGELSARPPGFTMLRG